MKRQCAFGILIGDEDLGPEYHIFDLEASFLICNLCKWDHGVLWMNFRKRLQECKLFRDSYFPFALLKSTKAASCAVMVFAEIGHCHSPAIVCFWGWFIG